MSITHLITLAASAQERSSAVSTRKQANLSRAVLGGDVRMSLAHRTAGDNALGGIARAHVDVVLAAEALEGFVGAGAGVGGLAQAGDVRGGGLARVGGDEGGDRGREDGGEEHLEVFFFGFIVMFVVIQGKKRTSLGSCMSNVSRKGRNVLEGLDFVVC